MKRRGRGEKLGGLTQTDGWQQSSIERVSRTKKGVQPTQAPRNESMSLQFSLSAMRKLSQCPGRELGRSGARGRSSKGRLKPPFNLQGPTNS